MSKIDEPRTPVDEPADHAVVKLIVPAMAEFVQVARMTVATLANKAAFTLDEVDDLRIAIDELSSMLVKAASPGAEVTLRFELAPGHLTVGGDVSSIVDGKIEAGLPELTERILDFVVDEYMLLADGQSLGFKFTKSHLPLDADS